MYYSLENENLDNVNIDTIFDFSDNANVDVISVIPSLLSPHNTYEDMPALFDIPGQAEINLEGEDKEINIEREGQEINLEGEDQEINIEGEGQDGLPRFCSLNDIISILKKIMIDQHQLLKTIFNRRENIENSQHYNFLKNKRKHIIKDCPKEDLSFDQKKRGRKTNTNKNTKAHGKQAPDNIYRKIKHRLLKYALKFLNRILDLEGENEGLVKLNYANNISKLERETDLMYLNMSLKDIFSSAISNKYRKRKDTFNKDKIEETTKMPPEKNKINHYYSKQFALNLKYKDFINLFTKKKKVTDMVSDGNEAFVDCKLIEQSLNDNDITHFITEEFVEKKKYDTEYFCLMLFYFYNLERYFNMKQIRKKRN